jgi:hypothetical protein
METGHFTFSGTKDELLRSGIAEASYLGRRAG